MLSLVPHKHNLTLLSIKYGGDKLAQGYIPHYQAIFGPIRKRPMTVLEIGVGGFSDPASGGESLRMWRDFFPNSRIYGIDIVDKSALDGGRIKTFRGDQSSPEFLNGLIAQIGRPHIIIDDGSHQPAHVRASFTILFPHLASDGIYVAEDLYTSYWKHAGGGWENGAEQNTSMSMMKGLVDALNYRYIPFRTPTLMDRTVVAVHFFRKIVFIRKGSNDLMDPDHVLLDAQKEEAYLRAETGTPRSQIAAPNVAG
jgi:hypothetical protein